MSSNEKDHNVLVVSRDENMRFIHEKSISNTVKEVRKQLSSSSFDVEIATMLAIVLEKILMISTMCMIEMNDS